MTIDEIRDNFALLDEWDDRYRYVIELGRSLEPMPEEAHTAANKVNDTYRAIGKRVTGRSGHDMSAKGSRINLPDILKKLKRA